MGTPLPTPVHYWNFDEQSGKSAADAAGGLHAAADQIASVAGKWKNALRFGGSDGAKVVTLGGSELAPPWSVSAWIRRDKDTSGATLLSSPGCAIKVDQYGTKSKLGITKFGVADWSIDKGLPLGEWAHLVVVCTATETKFYVGGLLAGTLAQSIPLPRTHLGSTGGWIEFLEGALEDLKLYNQALTLDQVTELAAAVPPSDKPKNQWVDLGDSATAVTALTLPDGRFAVFGIGADGKLWMRRQLTRGGDFSAARVLAEKAVTLAAALNADGRVCLSYHNSDKMHTIRSEKTPGGDWDDGQVIGGGGMETTLTSHQDGRLVALVRGSSGGTNVWIQSQTTPGGAFGKEENLGGSLTSGIAAARSVSGCIHLFVKWADNCVWYKAQTKANGPIDGQWTSLGGGCEGTPTANFRPNILEMYVRGSDKNVYTRYQEAGKNAQTGEVLPTGQWCWYSNLGAHALEPAAITAATGCTHVYVRGDDGNNQLWLNVQNGSGGWSGWTSLLGAIRGRPAPAANSSGVAVFAVGANGKLWMYW